MKKILLSALLCSVSPALFSQGTYSAIVVIDDIYWQNQNEWNGEFHAELYQGQTQIDNSSYTHYWYTRLNGQGTFQPYTPDNNGPSNEQDLWYNEYYEMKVTIDVPGYGLVESEFPTWFSKSGDPENVVFLPRRENGTPLALSSDVNVLIWSEYKWEFDFSIISDNDYVKVMYNPALGEKFHRAVHDPQGDIRYQNYAGYPVYYGSTPNEHVQNDFILHHGVQYNASVRAQLVDATSGYGNVVQFKDPWLEDALGVGGQYYSRGTSAPFKNLSYDQQYPYNVGINTSYRGVFLNQNDPNLPRYSVRAPQTPTINGFTSYFLGWSSSSAQITTPNNLVGGYYESPVVFTAGNATVTPRYKAHMGTGSPTLSDAKNQRRLLIENTSYWLMVYESGGDIWLTRSDDNGVTWVQEERMNTREGYAKNPTFSNIVYSSGVAYGILSWVEQNTGGAWQVYLQSFRMHTGGGGISHPVWYGWSGSGVNRSSSNHTILPTTFVPRYTARPVIQLTGYGSGVNLYYAFERNGSGICSGSQSYTFANDLADPDVFAEYTVSTNTQDICPVIIYYPAVPGASERLNLYYIGFAGYPLRIFQSTISGASKQQLPTSALNEITYHSLQGAVDPLSAKFALVADAQYGSNSRATVLYTKASYYGSSAPTVYAYYTNMMQPTVMVNKNGSWGYPACYIFHKSSSSSSWYQVTPSQSSSLIGTNIAGMFTREQIPSDVRTSIAVRTTTTPSQIQKYSGTGQLFKGEGAIVATNIKAFRHVKDENGNERQIVFDFTGADVRVDESLIDKNTICAMQVLEPRADGVITEKNDSLEAALALDIIRDGMSIKSYTSSSWRSLNAASLRDFSPGDAIKITGEKGSVSGYYEVNIVPVTLGKRSQDEELDTKTDEKQTYLVERDKFIKVYPNPFNASTVFNISLPRISNARLVVYDLLGRQVGRLVDGTLEAGDHSFQFDASRLSSGMYIYQLQLEGNIYSGRLMLLK